MGISLDDLQKQKEQLINQRETARSTMEQAHGALSLVEYFIGLLEKEEDPEETQIVET